MQTVNGRVLVKRIRWNGSEGSHTVMDWSLDRAEADDQRRGAGVGLPTERWRYELRPGGGALGSRGNGSYERGNAAEVGRRRRPSGLEGVPRGDVAGESGDSCGRGFGDGVGRGGPRALACVAGVVGASPTTTGGATPVPPRPRGLSESPGKQAQPAKFAGLVFLGHHGATHPGGCVQERKSPGASDRVLPGGAQRGPQAIPVDGECRFDPAEGRGGLQTNLQLRTLGSRVEDF